MAYDLSNYEEVKDRIPLFYERFPDGRIITEIVSEDENHVTIKTSLYADQEQQRALATGHAMEKPGGVIKAFTENCETSSIGRALANYNLYGNVAKDKGTRPSKEEMSSNVMTQDEPKPKEEPKAKTFEEEFDISDEPDVPLDAADVNWCPLHDEPWAYEDQYKGIGHYITSEKGHLMNPDGTPVVGTYQKDSGTLLNAKNYPRFCYQAYEGKVLGESQKGTPIPDDKLWMIWSNLGFDENYVKDNVLLCNDWDEAKEIHNVKTTGGLVRKVIDILASDDDLMWWN
tara:strand:+ start:387 stop:1244 length:858 start_codon:yes stop_codon:yes gene_type:complete